MELRGLEPLTPCMPCRCATSCATAPKLFLRNLCDLPKQPDQRSPEIARMRIGVMWLPSRSPGTQRRPAPPSGKEKIRRNLSIPADHPVELRGLEPLTPCMPCRCATSCATAPYSCCFSFRSLRSNSNILDQRFRKFQIGHIRSRGPTPARRQQLPLPKRRLPAAGPPPGSPSKDVPGHRRHGLPHAVRG